MIELYEYFLDTQKLEVFPEEIWSDPYVVFHGTSSFHSENIEREGLIVSKSPYEIESGTILVNLLNSNEIYRFDNSAKNIATSINDYLTSIQNNSFRLSFACLSSLCLSFSEGKSKGGQALSNIRKAKEIIESAHCENIISDIPQKVQELFHLEEQIANQRGVIYAIKLPESLEGITLEMLNIHSSISIPSTHIIGKVIIPDNTKIPKNLIYSNFNKIRNSQIFGPIYRDMVSYDD